MWEQIFEVIVFVGAGLGLLIVLGGILTLLGLGIPLVSLWWRDSHA